MLADPCYYPLQKYAHTNQSPWRDVQGPTNGFDPIAALCLYAMQQRP